MEKESRTYRSEEQWRELIKEQESSNITTTSFCREHNIAISNYYNWRKKLFGELPTSKRSKSFTKLEPVSTNTSTTGKIELDLPGGIKLTLSL